MFYMLSVFDLAPGVAADAFRDAYGALVDHMVGLGLAAGSAPVARRCRDTPLDTDTQLAQRYLALMQFADRAQADRAYDWIKARHGPADAVHRKVLSLAQDMTFLAWEDLDGPA